MATTWIGGANGSWHDANNWSTGIPGAHDIALIDTPTTISLTQDLTLKGLDIQAATNIEVAKDSTLTLENTTGDVLHSTHTLTLSGDGRLALGTDTTAASFTLDSATTTIALPITGDRPLIKNGSGRLELSGNNSNFLGDITLTAGILWPTAESALGLNSADRTITVLAGAALDMGGFTKDSEYQYTYQLRLAGSGPDNLGALRNSSTYHQWYTQPLIALTADASIGGQGRLDIRKTSALTTSTRLELNGHTLTICNELNPKEDYRSQQNNYYGCLALINTEISPASPSAPTLAGAILIKGNAMLSFEDNCVFQTPDDVTLTIEGTGVLDMYTTKKPLPWHIVARSGAVIRARSGNHPTNINRFTGSVSVEAPEGLILTDTANGLSLAFDCLISGTGGITAYGGINSSVYFHAPNNTYEGLTQVTYNRFRLWGAYPGSIPGWQTGQLTVSNEALVGVFLADAINEGWPLSQMVDLIESPAIVGDGGLAYDTGALSDPNFTWPSAADMTLQQHGPGHVVFATKMEVPRFMIDEGVADIQHPGPHILGYTRTYSGALVATNDATIEIGYSDQIYLGDKAGSSSLGNRIGGTASLFIEDIGYNRNQRKLSVGQNGRATLDITDEAKVSATIRVGSNHANAAGAIFQSGNSVVVNTTGAANDAGLGTITGAFGFYGLESGIYTNKGYFQVAQAKDSFGLFRQTGGEFIMPGGSTPAAGVVGDYYGGAWTLSRGGTAQAFILGGTFYHNNTLGIGGDGGSGSNSGSGTLVVGGAGRVTVPNSPLYLGRADTNAKDRKSDLVLAENGILQANHIYAAPNDGTWKCVNFNGGTYTSQSTEKALFSGDVENMPVIVYAGGITFDINRPPNATEASATARTIDLPLRAPSGAGITDLQLATPQTDYIAPPLVLNKYNGAHGHNGYVAEAIFDREAGAVTGIKVYSPGFDVSPQPIVTLKQSGRGDVDVALPVKANRSGGITKKGDADVILNAANTYTGPTTVLEGSLTLGHAAALSPATAITVGGANKPAVLNLNGHDITASRITLADGGTIKGAKITTPQIVKSGTGTATLAASPKITTLAPATTLTPGFWEGLTSRTAEDPFYYNPKQNVRLTTYAGNNGKSSNSSNSGGMWAGSNHTYAYTGYIWNRTTTNQTWNFRGAFDDHVFLVIDHSLVLHKNGNSGDPKSGSFVATPGPHFIDVRFGDGSGDVGCNLEGMLGSGLNWDAGDGAGWRVVADPGDGSIITTTSINWDAAEFNRNALPGQPGLFEGTVGGCGNSVEPNPCDGGVQLTLRAANGSVRPSDGNNQSATLPNGYTWWNYSSAIYSGYIWNRSGATQNWTFIQNLDDTCLIVMDGTVLLSGRLNDSATRLVTVAVTPGPHAFEVRFGQHGGGAGGNVIPGSAFGIDLQGRNTTESNNFIIPYAYDNGMPEIYTEAEPFFTTTLNGYSTPAQNAILVEEGTLQLQSTLTAGLYEGMVREAWDMTTPNPCTSIQLTTRAGNGPQKPNDQYANGLWVGNNHTWIYSGYLWNRSAQDVTWRWRFFFDDNVALWIDDHLVGNSNHNNGIVYESYTLTPGPHKIEIRYGDGSGHAGPASGVGGLTYDPTNSGSTDANDYLVLADDGSGDLLTTTADTPDYSEAPIAVAPEATLDLNGGAAKLGELSGEGQIINGSFAAGSIYRVKIEGQNATCATFNNVDLSQLTVMPADAASASPPGHTYQIAAGTFNTVPQLAGFNPKYKLLIRNHGQALVLTSQFTMILILR